MPEEQYTKFDDWKKIIKKPFVIYADLESLLVPDDKFDKRHEPLAAAGVLIHNDAVDEYATFHGVGCITKFLTWVEKMATEKVYPYYSKIVPMTPLTLDEEALFHNTNTCYLCHKVSSLLCHDHDHFTGEYLGAACCKCNLSRKVKPSLQIVFHNLKGYDMHHLLKYAFCDFPKWDFSAIPISTEKFLTITAFTEGKMKLMFIDSYQFLSASLSNLTKSLDAFPLTSTVFQTNIVKGKGIFPYEMATSVENLENITSLPSKWSDSINDEDYSHA